MWLRFFTVLLVVFALIFVGDAVADETVTSPDGRFDTQCDAPGTAAEARICEVPFARLIATPERFDGKLSWSPAI